TKIFEIVHQANMGKLFPDGKPHYHPVTNKVLKPDNWEEQCAPEPKIAKEIQRQIAQATRKKQS
ncbi:HAD family hydrolase, partial [Escherichia coli]|nr:HAD family hydrolase [Escherichia coli]